MYSRYIDPKFKSKNQLDFWSKNYEGILPDNKKEDRIWFIVGTCNGIYLVDESKIEIRTINNKQPGNGHFGDALEWFEHFCKRDNKDLIIWPIHDNEKFRNHLLNKCGFIEHGSAGAKKIFRQL